jgi:hypothetical protein
MYKARINDFVSSTWSLMRAIIIKKTIFIIGTSLFCQL